MSLKREVYIKKVTSYMSYILTILKLDNSQGFVDLNSIIENTTALLLNEVYEWDLKNQNKSSFNYPGIDLADDKNKIAVQITTNKRHDKIQHTIDEYIKNKYHIQFKRLVVFIWTEGKGRTNVTFDKMGLIAFTPEKDVITIPMLLHDIRNLQTEKIKKIVDILENEIVFYSKDNKSKHIDETQLIKAIDKYKNSLREYKNYTKCFDERLLTSISINKNSGEGDSYLRKFAKDNLEYNIFCYGEGGIGKTINLINLWEQLIEEGVLAIYVPLKKLNINRYGTTALKEWIMNRILIHINNNGELDLDDVYNVFDYYITNNVSKKFVFLLDGVNEVKELDICKGFIDEWIDRTNVSLVVSSRNIELFSSGYKDLFLLVRFNNFDEKAINSILDHYNYPSDVYNHQIQALLSTPQLVMWFLGTAHFGEDIIADKYLDVREIHSHSDLFHNYLESEIYKLAIEIHICTWFEAILLYGYIIPTIAWEIYLSGESFLSFKAVNKTIYNIVNRVNTFDSIFPQRLSFAYNADVNLDSKKLFGIILHNMEIFEFDENNNVRFVHENYIPMLIMMHWINIARDILETGNSLAEVNCWNSSIIPANSIQYISSTKGAVLKPDTDIIDGYWEVQRNKTFSSNDLELMNLIRVYNVLNNGVMNDMDFSNMDLRFTILNGASFGDDFHGAKFCNSLISANTFAPQGQHAAILQIFFKNSSNYFYIRDFHGNLAKIERAIDKKDWSIECGFTNEIESKYGIIECVSNDTDVFSYRLYYIMNGWLQDWFVRHQRLDNGKIYEYHLDRKIRQHVKAFLYLGSKKRFLIATQKHIYLLDETVNALSEYNSLGKIDEKFDIIDLYNNNAETAAIVLCNDKESKKLAYYYIDLNKEYLVRITKTYDYFTNREILITHDGAFFLCTVDHAIYIINISNGEIIHVINEDITADEAIHSFKISDDNNWLVISVISKSLANYRISVWEVNHEQKYEEYLFDEFISSIVFSPDSKYIIIGLWNGSIEEIELLSGNRRTCAHGYRVDQHLSIVNDDLFVRRSDGIYCVWDFRNKHLKFKPQRYLRKELKNYSITENGRYWYKIDNKDFCYCEEGSMKINTVPFEYEPECFTVLNDVIYVCLKWEVNEELIIFRISLNTKPEITRYIFSINELINKKGRIRDICVNKEGKLIAVLYEEHIEKVDFLDCGPRYIIILDVEKEEVIHNILLEDDACRILNEKFKLLFYEDVLFILLFSSSELLSIDIQENRIYDLGLSEYLSKLLNNGNENVENDFLKDGLIMISPSGDTIKSNTKTSLKKIKKAIMTDSGKMIIGYANGVVICIDFIAHTHAIYKVTDYRLEDIIVMSNSKEEICFASHKDDKIHIYDIKNCKYFGYLYTMPNTYITNCDFSNAIFESQELKEAIKMNGAIVTD